MVEELTWTASILNANENFHQCDSATRWAEIKGQNHSMFVLGGGNRGSPDTAGSGRSWGAASMMPGVTGGWPRAGARYRMQGSYNPILDQGEERSKWFGYATDITVRR